MKTITLLTTIALTSCAGWNFSIRSPYGDVESAKDGSVAIIPKPIIVPAQSAK